MYTSNKQSKHQFMKPKLIINLLLWRYQTQHKFLNSDQTVKLSFISCCGNMSLCLSQPTITTLQTHILPDWPPDQPTIDGCNYFYWSTCM